MQAFGTASYGFRGRQLTVSPGVVPARGEAEQTGNLGDGEAGLSRSQELEGFAGTEPVSRANQAEALQGFHAHDATADFHGEARRARRSPGRRHGVRRRDRPEGSGIHESGPPPLDVVFRPLPQPTPIFRDTRFGAQRTLDCAAVRGLTSFRLQTLGDTSLDPFCAICPTHDSSAYTALLNACFRSSMRSSGCSNPIESRIRPSVTPAALRFSGGTPEWVVEAG